MKKVELRLDEEEKFRTIKKLVETNGNKEAAAIRLGCSRRHINRMIRGYRKQGQALFLHENRTREDVANLYATKYEEWINTDGAYVDKAAVQIGSVERFRYTQETIFA